MRIESTKINIEIDNQEARDLAYHILRSLKQSINDHYIQLHHDSYKRGYEGHAKPLLYEQEGESIQMMKELMSTASGDGQFTEEDMLRYFEDEYKKKNGSLILDERTHANPHTNE